MAIYKCKNHPEDLMTADEFFGNRVRGKKHQICEKCYIKLMERHDSEDKSKNN
ncbi:MAG: hypothetical protein HYR79_05515 [Nitrospirae bacterium]|nr:hypothetical protein [Nitrospirota bacterium]